MQEKGEVTLKPRPQKDIWEAVFWPPINKEQLRKIVSSLPPKERKSIAIGYRVPYGVVSLIHRVGYDCGGFKQDSDVAYYYNENAPSIGYAFLGGTDAESEEEEVDLPEYSKTRVDPFHMPEDEMRRRGLFEDNGVA